MNEKTFALRPLTETFFLLAPIFSASLLAYAMPKCVGATLIKRGYFCSKFMVSLAIISSSSVGITHTVTFESGVEMIASSPRTLLASASIFTPKKLKA